MRSLSSTCAMVTSMGLLGACQEPAHEPQNPPATASVTAPPNASSVPAPIAPPASAAQSASAVPSTVGSTAPGAPRPAPPAAPPQGARLAMFVARALRAPQKPSQADQASVAAVLKDATPSQAIDLDMAQNSCGARAGGTEPIRIGGGSTNAGLGGLGGSQDVVQVGLAPHPGMTPLEEQQARIAIWRMESGVASCLSPLARKNPTLLGASLRVSAATTGEGTRTTLTILPNGTSDDVKTCVTGAIAPLIIGDATHAQLLFDVRIDKTPK